MKDENILHSELGKYLKQLHETYKNKDQNSLSEILNNFKQISKDYVKFSENKSEVSYKYSNPNFELCTPEEQQYFINDQLQLIECLVLNKIYEMNGSIYGWNFIYNLIKNPDYSNVQKTDRKVIYSTMSRNRPVGDKSYLTWNGFQIIDLDIKDSDLSDKLKPIIFNELNKYTWFLGVYKSASGRGLHIWTKITPLSIELKNKRIEYLCNFRHKYSYVYIVLKKYAKQFGYTSDDILQYMDMAMAKPQQGSFIAYDPNPLMNTGFQDLRLDVNFESAFDTGIESINWISHPDLKEVFSKLDWFANDDFDSKVNIDVANIENIDHRDKSKSLGRKHYKHAQRWQLANTLVALYGEERAFSIIMEICKDTPAKELRGDIKTAAIHNKPISIWAIKELNSQHGFQIKLNENNLYKDEIEQLENKLGDDSSTYEDPTKILNDKTAQTVLKMKHGQYLSDIKDDIMKNLSNITLLEAGAGYGKTEMIKAFKAKTLLILPFTSTIKAKVESSDTTKDWLYYYGNKRPSLEDILSDKSMSMTIDKFSRLNVMELNQADFKYIVIDESHLLFTSSYRDVMSPTIQRIANCSAKVIMMTGTPTGEMLFFPNIKHIKIIKEDFREKKFELHMCPTSMEQFVEMCKCMADDIKNNRKILYPTNKGNLYFEQVTGLIQEILNSQGVNRNLKAFYYKKSNYGEETMDSINIDKSVGDNDIIFCTTYLSVGVDICDRYTFSVYFNETWIPQDIEQFANRLRNNDLYIKMFLPAKDNLGIPYNYYYTKPLDLSFDKADLLLARDMIRTCNDLIERNQEDSKYNPVISSILGANRYLKYDENDCKYYIDETTYKLKVFEERYSEYSKQLQVLLNGIRYYGYDVEWKTHSDEIDAVRRAEIEEYLRTCKNIRYNEQTIKTLTFLDHINDGNIDIYKELLRGSYEIFKDEKYKEDREENGLYVEDIEILEKNLPIVLTLYKYYDCDTIKDIFTYCIERKSNRINYSKLGRIRKFVIIEANRRRKRLDFPVLKYIRDAQNYAQEHITVNVDEVVKWIGTYTAKYANSIPGLVVEDVLFLENLYQLLKDLWSVVIIQSRPHKGMVTIRPFELLWERKNKIENIYGNIATQTFFLQELVDGMRDDEGSSVLLEEDEEKDLQHAKQFSIADIQDEISNIVHKEFEYDDYSKQDGSNRRFLRKQENTNKLADTIFMSNDNVRADEDSKDINEIASLFSNTGENEPLPF